MDVSSFDSFDSLDWDAELSRVESEINGSFKLPIKHLYDEMTITIMSVSPAGYTVSKGDLMNSYKYGCYIVLADERLFEIEETSGKKLFNVSQNLHDMVEGLIWELMSNHPDYGKFEALIDYDFMTQTKIETNKTESV